MCWGRKAILLDLVKDLRCINAKYLSKPKSFVVNDKRQAAKSGSTKSSYGLIVDDEKKYQKAVTFSNGQTRQLINILLHETRVEGDRGIFIPFRCIRFAVLSPNHHSLRDKMKGLHSGLIQEPMDSSLRFTNYIACLLYRMKQGYPVKDPVDAFLQEAKRISSNSKTHLLLNPPNHKQ